MSRIVLVLLVSGVVLFGGCSVMERNHYMPAFNEVPTEVKLAFSDKYPNDAIQMNKTMAQTMFDGTVRYKLVVLNSKNVEREVTYLPDGTEVK